MIFTRRKAQQKVSTWHFQSDQQINKPNSRFLPPSSSRKEAEVTNLILRATTIPVQTKLTGDFR